MVIAFDVDDTLLLPPEATGLEEDTPSEEVIAVYNWFKKQGHTMVVWSGGGVEYARMWADRLSLAPDMVVPKTLTTLDGQPYVDIAFDDCDINLGKVNVKVKRLNNNVQRTLPNERKKQNGNT